FTSLRDLQQKIEAMSGAFELGEWQEFVKRYGHLIIWTLANLRQKWIAEVEGNIRYVDSHKKPFLHCIAIYEYHEPEYFSDVLNKSGGWEHDSSIDHPSDSYPKIWIQKSSIAGDGPVHLTSRLTLTPSQLVAEADSLDHFNDLKHFLASTFGFSLHFKGETNDEPSHSIPKFDLLQEELPHVSKTVSTQEEHRLLSQLLESAYLGWAEHSCPALHNQTPRHVACQTEGKDQVANLINEMEQYDLAKERTGELGFDYNMLRSHVGLEPVQD
ncbi:MAG: hypothetical protein IH978_10595, partial [Nitrospinae bacterium]|nr:hypothetical protein [Nitrospinota bacterium]